MYAQIWALPVCPATCSCHSARVRVWRNLQYQEVEAYWWVGLDNMQFLCQSVPPNFPWETTGISKAQATTSKLELQKVPVTLNGV